MSLGEVVSLLLVKAKIVEPRERDVSEAVARSLHPSAAPKPRLVASDGAKKDVEYGKLLKGGPK